mmetsp:Transcript_16978/g.35237  ORF Transcript_16978/g.35237 Transcript_16978/m.35237 type:complete len:1058 (-) Transcript_16978:1674-4847(-)
MPQGGGSDIFDENEAVNLLEDDPALGGKDEACLAEGKIFGPPHMDGTEPEAAGSLARPWVEKNLVGTRSPVKFPSVVLPLFPEWWGSESESHSRSDVAGSTERTRLAPRHRDNRAQHMIWESDFNHDVWGRSTMDATHSTAFMSPAGVGSSAFLAKEEMKEFSLHSKLELHSYLECERAEELSASPKKHSLPFFQVGWDVLEQSFMSPLNNKTHSAVKLFHETWKCEDSSLKKQHLDNAVCAPVVDLSDRSDWEDLLGEIDVQHTPAPRNYSLWGFTSQESSSGNIGNFPAVTEVNTKPAKKVGNYTAAKAEMKNNPSNSDELNLEEIIGEHVDLFTQSVNLKRKNKSSGLRGLESRILRKLRKTERAVPIVDCGTQVDVSDEGDMSYVHKEVLDAEQIQSIFENNSFADADSEMETPFQLAISLLPHQKRALHWMHKRECSARHPRGGILADEMGLGKTLSLISLLLTRPPIGEDGNPGYWRTLIIAPASVLHQWKREIHDMISPGFRPTVGFYHGDTKQKVQDHISLYDVVLTSYMTVAIEARKKTAENSSGFLSDTNWFRIVLDESQMIKNQRTSIFKSILALQATHRWCLTGTPIENTLDDLWSQFQFLRFDANCPHGYSEWKKRWKLPLERERLTENKKRKIEQFQIMLGPVCLRRRKRDQHHGQEILSLPPVTIEIHEIQFSTEERSIYNAIETKNSLAFKEMLRAGEVMRNYMDVLVLLLRLRQVCDHHGLIKYSFEAEDLKSVSKQIDEGNCFLKRFKPSVRAMVESVVASSNENPQNVHCAVCGMLNTPDTLLVTECIHVICADCISLVHDRSGECPICKASISDQAQMSLLRTQLEHKVLDLREQGHYNSFLAQLENEKKDDIKNQSSKLKYLIQELRTTRERDPNEKTLVFSQWTSMLNLIQDALELEEFGFVRLDGTMDAAKKNAAVCNFRKRSDVTIMLISLRAGGAGINLTAASQVILFDFWWNPAVEDQAIARAHRLGQKRPVKVLRLKISDSVEGRMLALQEKKRAIFNNALGGEQTEFKGRQQLTLQDLMLLFDVRPGEV